MTTATLLRSEGSFVTGTEPSTWIEKLRVALADYRAYRHTLAELRALTDKQLSDIGMRRNALKPVARSAIYDI